MQYEEYEKLIEELQKQLLDAGIRGISDEALYLRRDPESGERYLPHPRVQLVEMLEALDRHLAVWDLDTYNLALDIINNSIIESEVLGAEIFLSDRQPNEMNSQFTRAEPEPQTIYFADLQPLKEVRTRLNELIGELDNPNQAPGQDPTQDPENGAPNGPTFDPPFGV